MRVVIEGAGIVGRSIARELLGNGHRVLLIDRSPAAMKITSVPDAQWLLADACEIASLDEAKSVKQSLEARTVAFAARAGRGGRLFGAVTPADVALAVTAAGGTSIDKRKVEIYHDPVTGKAVKTEIKG